MRSRLIPAVLLVLVVVAAGVVLWHRGGGRAGHPTPGAADYAKVVNDFFSGTVALEATNPEAEARLLRAAKAAPGEPAIWANLGVLKLRSQKFEEAAELTTRALALAGGKNDRMLYNLAIIEEKRSNATRAMELLRQAAEANPRNAFALYALADALRRQQGTDRKEVEALLDRVLALYPRSLPVVLDRLAIAGEGGDAEAFKKWLALAGETRARWDDSARSFYEQLTSSTESVSAVAARVRMLRNVLSSQLPFRQAYVQIVQPNDEVGLVMRRFLKLKNPPASAAPADTGCTYTEAPDLGGRETAWVGSVLLNGDPEAPANARGTKPELALAFGGRLAIGGQAIGYPTSGPRTALGQHAVLPVDLDNDYRMDFVFAGPGGLRIFRQSAAGTLQDATAGARLPAGLTARAFLGAWAADVDADGDVDILLAPESGGVVTLRNNKDGTFAVQTQFDAVKGARDFAWVDLDGDGDQDAAFVDGQGRLVIFQNERGGTFLERKAPDLPGRALSVSAEDLDQDGQLDLAVLMEQSLLRVSDRDAGQAWDVAEVLKFEGTFGRAHFGDLDNNGARDLVLTGDSGAAAYLRGPSGAFEPGPKMPDGLIVDQLADTDEDGTLDLVGRLQGKAAVYKGKRSKSYGWQVLRPRGLQKGDNRVNSFAIGGEMQLRAGLLVQAQAVSGPSVHFGLGDQPSSTATRIVWPNGTVQIEFEHPANSVVKSPQRLKGSCPWLFTWNGESMVFVTDFIWRSPLGLKINAQTTAKVQDTLDWVRIRGDQLAPREGHYDVRITAELWETHFFDHIALMVVDHPSGTEIAIDERFAFEPYRPRIYLISTPSVFWRARDDRGEDISPAVNTLDGRHHDMGRGEYQGVTRDHWVELELPPDAPSADELALIGFGWVHPTDTSINVALGQGSHTPPRALSMEVPDGKGGWRAARPNVGFPAGKTKTVVLELKGLWRPGEPRKLRLRTTMEIYWDRLAWARLLQGPSPRTVTLLARSADLRHRGYSRTTQDGPSAPELPDYNVLEATGQRWRDLVGFYTRFGDVRELLKAIDDRYVIMNAGDELRLLFAEQPPPPPGWRRDYVLIGDGWVKDGDLNTTWSRTVEPLPFHGNQIYENQKPDLRRDPMYLRHRADWQTYHTRYVDPVRFHTAIRRSD